MPVMNSMDAVVDECLRLRSLDQGWEFIPCDDPDQASFGMLAFRRVSSEGEPIPVGKLDLNAKDEEVRFEWLPYGKHLVPHVQEVSDVLLFRELVDRIRPMGIFPYNNQDRLKVGFVGYDGETAHVVRIPLHHIKDPNFDEALLKEIQINSVLRMHARLRLFSQF